MNIQNDIEALCELVREAYPHETPKAVSRVEKWLKSEDMSDKDEYSCSCNEGGKTENHIFWSKDDYRESGSPICQFCDDDMFKI